MSRQVNTALITCSSSGIGLDVARARTRRIDTALLGLAIVALVALMNRNTPWSAAAGVVGVETTSNEVLIPRVFHRTVKIEGPLDLKRTLRPLNGGRGHPKERMTSSRAWRASRNPENCQLASAGKKLR